MTDLRLAFRMMRKQPGMSALAVVALALGIGLTTTMFSIVYGAALRGLPFEESERIHVLSRQVTTDGGPARTEQGSVHDYVDWRARQTSFDDLAGFSQFAANVVGPDGTPERYRGLRMTPNTFRLLRTAPALGRDFLDGEEKPGAEPVVIISDKVWRERFKSDPNAIGEPLRVNGVAMTVVGVMPPKFAFPQTQELWTVQTVDAAPATRAQSPRLTVIGRMRRDASLDQAKAELATIGRQLAQEYPDLLKDRSVTARPFMEEFMGEMSTVFATMLVAVFGVLVIACANVANLVLARAADRVREVAVRAAMGASRARIVKQMLAEVLALTVLGAAAGVGLAAIGVTLFNRSIVDTSPPFWIDIKIDGMVMLFVVCVALLAAVISGIVPAWRASTADLAAIMKDEGRTTGLRLGRFSKGLVVAEMALSFALLVASGMVTRSIINISNVDFGFPIHDVLTARVQLTSADYPDEERRRQFADALLAKVQALPGVVSAALATDVAPNAQPQRIKFLGKTYENEREYPNARGATVTPDYFKVLRTSAVRGRLLNAGDRAGAEPVALVNQSFERRFFPNGAIGQQFALAQGNNTQWRTIVGVVPDLGFGRVNQGQIPEGFYLPLPQLAPSGFAIVAHAAGVPSALSAPIREAVRSVDSNLPVVNIMTIEQAKDQGTWAFRVFGSLFMAFGFAALFLATVGLYGVMAFAVSKRTQEIGVRMAIGAASQDVLRLVLRQGLWQVGIGMAIGLGLAVALTSFMTIFLFDVTARDPLTFIVIFLVLGVTGVLACLIPARRASRVDPMVALRCQ